MNRKQFLIKPFNTVFFVFFGLLIGLTYLASRVMSSYSTSQFLLFFQYVAQIQFIHLVIYRIVLFTDKEYCQACYGKDRVNYYNELPFFPCNLITLLTPFALVTGYRWLCAFCFFVSFIGPLFALIFPAKGFEEYSLFKPRMFMFYVYHYICMLYPFMFIRSGFFIPDVYDCFLATATAFVFALVAFFINLIMVKNGINEDANYFFVYDPSFNPVLSLFYRYIPFRFLYSIPVYPILFILCLIIRNLIV